MRMLLRKVIRLPCLSSTQRVSNIWLWLWLLQYMCMHTKRFLRVRLVGFISEGEGAVVLERLDDGHAPVIRTELVCPRRCLSCGCLKIFNGDVLCNELWFAIEAMSCVQLVNLTQTYRAGINTAVTILVAVSLVCPRSVLHAGARHCSNGKLSHSHRGHPHQRY